MWTLLLVVLLAPSLCNAAPKPANSGLNDEDGKPSARLDDVKFISCQVCNTIVFQAVNSTKFLRTNLKYKEKLSEADILSNMETMCNPWSDSGHWINKIDIVEEGTTLRLAEQTKAGKLLAGDCGTECWTVALTCETVMEKIDYVDFSEALFSGKKDQAALTKWLCHGKGAPCAKPPPPVPEDRIPGPEFETLENGSDRRQQKRTIDAVPEADKSIVQGMMERQTQRKIQDELDLLDGGAGKAAAAQAQIAEAVRAGKARFAATQAAEAAAKAAAAEAAAEQAGEDEDSEEEVQAGEAGEAAGAVSADATTREPVLDHTEL